MPQVHIRFIVLWAVGERSIHADLSRSDFAVKEACKESLERIEVRM